MLLLYKIILNHGNGLETSSSSTRNKFRLQDTFFTIFFHPSITGCTTSVVLYIMSRTGWLPTKPINQSYILNFPRYFLLQIRGSAMYNTDRVFNFVKLFHFPAGCISSNPTTRGHESSFVFYLSPHQASEVAFNREIGPGSKNEYPVQVSLINYIIILIYFSLIDILLFVLYVL